MRRQLNWLAIHAHAGAARIAHSYINWWFYVNALAAASKYHFAVNLATTRIHYLHPSLLAGIKL